MTWTTYSASRRRVSRKKQASGRAWGKSDRRPPSQRKQEQAGKKSR